MAHPLNSVDISIFSPEISNFCYIKKYRYRLKFNTYFIFFNFFWVFENFLNKHGHNFDGVSKIGSSSLLVSTLGILN